MKITEQSRRSLGMDNYLTQIQHLAAQLEEHGDVDDGWVLNHLYEVAKTLRSVRAYLESREVEEDEAA